MAETQADGVPPEQAPWLQARLGAWFGASWRHHGWALAAVGLVTLLLAPGLFQVETAVDPVDAMPRGNEHTAAARNVSESFRSTFNQQATLVVTVDPGACRQVSQQALPERHGPGGEPGPTVRCGNITDEVYLRATAEFFDFVTAYAREHPIEPGGPTPFPHLVALPSFYALYNWTLAGGQDEAPPEAFALPGPRDRLQTSLVLESGWEVLGQAVLTSMDPDHEATLVFLLPEPKSPYAAEELGRFALEAREAYLAWAPGNATYPVFTGDNPPRFAVNTPIARAHGAELVQADLVRVFAALAVLGTLVLAVAYRDVALVGVAWTTGLVTMVWTGGLMGYLGLPLGPFSLAVAPVILGLGLVLPVRYASDLLGLHGTGRSQTQAAAAAGGPVGGAFTVAGGAALAACGAYALSPSPLYADMALTCVAGLASLLVLLPTLVPALSRVAGLPHARDPRRPVTEQIPRLRALLHRHRGPVVVLLVALTATGLYLGAGLGAEPLKSPPENFPAEDPLRVEHDQALAAFYNTEPGETVFRAELVVVQGEITTPESHAYLDDLLAELQATGAVQPTMNTNNSQHLPGVIRTWLEVRNGPASIVQGQLLDPLAGQGLRQAERYPGSQQEIEAVLDEMFTAPMATFASLSIDHPADRITVIPVPMRTTSADQVPQAFHALERARTAASPSQPAEVTTAFAGRVTAEHLVQTHQLPWLWALPLVGLSVLGVLGYLFTGTAAGAGLVLLPASVTTAWGLGAMRLLGLGLNGALVVPFLLALVAASPVAYWYAVRRGAPPWGGWAQWRWTGAVAANLLLALSVGLLAPVDAVGWPGVRELTLASTMQLSALVVVGGALAGLCTVSLLTEQPTGRGSST